MKNLTFSPLYVARLPLNGVYSITKSTIDLAKPVSTQIGPIALASLGYMETLNQQLLTSLNSNSKSAFTAAINDLDAERDADVKEIKRVTASYLKSSNAEKKAAASALQLFLAPYWEVAKLAFDIETGVLSELLGKYNARTDLNAAAKTLDIDGLFVTLEAKNTAFDEKYKSRNTEYSERGEAASNVRPALTTAYNQFCTAIEQMLNFAPNDTVTALFNQLDELRKKYHLQEGGSEPKPVEAAN